MKGFEILNNPFLNKGTAFTIEERERYGLVGLLPPAVQTIDEQAEQSYNHMKKKPSKIQQREFLMEIFNTNRTLFFRIFQDHIKELNPIVYDPVIATSIEDYNDIYVQSQYAAFLDVNHPEKIEEVLQNASKGRHIKLIVVTDAEGILGIGDWGVGGVDISIGKLMIYTVAAGIDPSTVLPIVIDAGTNRQELLDNPFYLGNREKRITGEAYDSFIDKFVQTAEKLFPGLYLHWEDFGRSHAAKILNRYKDKIPTFNDDIQGTGIVSLAGILSGLAQKKERLTDQTYLCVGAGSAGAGIARRVWTEMVSQGLSEEEAYKHFYLFDKEGLLFDDMSDLTPEQRPFARKRSEFAGVSTEDLLGVVKAVKPTIMVGTSTKPGYFSKEIVEYMCSYCPRPIIFPLSNPTKLAEANAKDLLEWSQGGALVATGIPSGTVKYGGTEYEIGQANNALIYPGLGLGVLSSKARLLTDDIISSAAHSVADMTLESNSNSVLPRFKDVNEVSKRIARAIFKIAVERGLTDLTINDMENSIEESIWTPEYRLLEL